MADDGKKFFGKKKEACRRCPYATHPFVPPQGSFKSKSMWVGESPWVDEVEQGQPFVGRAGQRLNKLFKLSDIDRTKQYITNAVKCKPGEDEGGINSEAIELCYKLFLRHEIEKVKPVVVVPMGNTALQSTIGRQGITSQRGIARKHEFKLKGSTYKCKVLPSYHPSYIDRQPGLEALAVSDFSSVKWQSSAVKVLTQGKADYKVLASKEEALKFFSELKEAGSFSLDTETTDLDDRYADIICISFSCKPYVARALFLYSPHPKKVKWAWDSKLLLRLYKLIHSGTLLYLQNGKFDLRKLRVFFKKTLNLDMCWDKINWHDTMLMHNLLDENLPKNLKDMSRLYTDIVYSKEELDVVRGGLCHKASPSDLVVYACKDADATMRLGPLFEKKLKAEGLWPLYIEKEYSEMTTAKALLEVELFGIPINKVKLKALGRDIKTRLKQLKKRMYAISGKKFNPRSPDQLSKIMFDTLRLPYHSEMLTDGGKPSTNADALDWIIQNSPKVKRKFPKALKLFRQYDKIRGTFVRGLLDALVENK